MAGEAIVAGAANRYFRIMQTVLFVLIILAALGAAVSVVRGVIVMLRTSREDMEGPGVSQSGLRQNKMMWRRVQFQALAIVFVILFLLVARGHGG